MTRFRKSSSTGQKRLGTNSRRVVKGLKRKRRRHLSASASLLSTSLPANFPAPSPSPTPAGPSRALEEAQNVAVGSGMDLHFPRSAHDYHAEQGRHEQKGQVRHHCRKLDSLSAHRAWWRWVEVSVGWLPSALEPLFRRGSTFAWTDCSRTRKLQVPVHSMTASSLMMYPLELHFVLDGGTFSEKRSPALVCWSRIARERTAIQSVFPLERDGV